MNFADNAPLFEKNAPEQNEESSGRSLLKKGRYLQHFMELFLQSVYYQSFDISFHFDVINVFTPISLSFSWMRFILLLLEIFSEVCTSRLELVCRFFE